MKTFLVTVLGTADAWEFERGGDPHKQKVEAESMYGSDFYRKVARDVLLSTDDRFNVNGIIANARSGLQVLSFEWREVGDSIIVAVEERRT